MRQLMAMIGLLVAALLAACAPAGSAEPTVNSEPAAPTADSGPALNPAPGSGASYPSAGEATDGYPAAGPESALPDGYPDGASGTLVAPVEVDLSQLTPVAGDTTPREAPAPGRPDTPAISQGLLLEAVTMSLSEQFGVPAESVTVVSVEPVTWPDAGLGCPQEGLAYAQVMVEGSRITLEAGGETYTYHTAGTSEFVLCIDGAPAAVGTVPRR